MLEDPARTFNTGQIPERRRGVGKTRRRDDGSGGTALIRRRRRARKSAGCLRAAMLRSLTLVITGVAMTMFWSGCHPGYRTTRRGVAVHGPIRAIWVTRWDYKSPRDIATIMEDCRTAGFNTVLFQVRGNGTVFYRSKIEPWADELGGRDPGFDPLTVACREAHHRGLSLHAWANVIPGWRGDKPPTNPAQLYHAHPEWFWRDAAGYRQPLGWYSSLNPCYPEVRRYLAAVMHEIIAEYPVDGLHLDYIRFPNEWNKAYPRGARVPDYPRDPRTLALFRRATGRTPDEAPARWRAWRTEQITQLVRDIHRMVRDVSPRLVLSAAVGADPDKSRRRHFQDAKRWISEGLVDAIYPMNYSGDVRAYDKILSVWSAMRSPVPVVIGVMFDKRDGSLVVQQIDHTSRSGSHFAAFAYNSLFERLDARGRRLIDEQSLARRALRRRVIPYLRRLAARRTSWRAAL